MDAKRSFTVRWIFASALGWLVGFALVLVLAMVVEAFAGGVQVVVGFGMGAGVGYMQSRVLRRWIESPWPWFQRSVIGMTIPFLLQDLTKVFGLTLPTSLWLYVPVGGLLVAFMQQKLLSQISDVSGSWIGPCVVGWAIPVLLIALGDEVDALGVLGGFLSLAGMFFGGIALGAVTAKPMESLLPELAA